MTTAQTILVSMGSSTVLTAAVTGVFAVIRDGYQIKHGIAAGTREILRDRIKYLCKHHIRVGYITAEDLEDVMNMHQIYHDELKGNGYLDTLMEHVRALPISPVVIIEKGVLKNENKNAQMV